MIQITPQMRLLLAIEPVDFGKGIGGLAGLCRQALGTDPLSGALIVFRSRSRRALKLLVYDGQGFWLAQKRLSQERFAWPTPVDRIEGRADYIELQVNWRWKHPKHM